MGERRCRSGSGRALLLLVLSLVPWTGARAAFAQGAPEYESPVVVTEFLSSNQDGLRDEDGDSSDWIELFNRSDEPVALDGWYLTDDAGDPVKWQIPDFVLGPGEYRIIWASSKDRDDPAEALHTNFKLGAEGEYFALVEPDGRTMATEFELAFPPQYPDVSYGLANRADPGAGAGRFDFGDAPRYRYLRTPTPGAANTPDRIDPDPFIFDVAHQPPFLRPGGPLYVSARVAPGAGAIDAVVVEYRVDFAPGSTLALHDDGEHADGAPGDGIFAGLLPTESAPPGSLVRYAVSARSDAGPSASFPPRQGGSPSPRWAGTIVRDPEVRTQIPVFDWFVEDAAAFAPPEGNEEGAAPPRRPAGWTAACLFYAGTLYDNVRVRVRPGMRASWLAPPLEFDFNPGHEFRFSPNTDPVASFFLESVWGDPSCARLALGSEVCRRAGARAPVAFPVHTRLNGVFHRLSVFLEKVDGAFLRRNQLDGDGAVYEAEGAVRAVGESEAIAHLGTRRGMQRRNGPAERSAAELDALIAGLAPESPRRREFLFDRIDLPQTLNVLAVYALLKHYDRNTHGYAVCFDRDGTGLWSLVPTEFDLVLERLDEPIRGRRFPGHPLAGSSDLPTWSPEHWNRLVDAVADIPEVRAMYLRRLRTVLDEVLQPPDTPQRQRELEAWLAGARHALAPEAERDQERWGLLRGGIWGEPERFPEGLDQLADALEARRRYLYGLDLLPPAQGSEIEVQIGALDAEPASGRQEEEFVELRNESDSVAVDLSGWRMGEAVSHMFRPGTVIPANGSLYLTADSTTFRASAFAQERGPGLLVETYRSSFGLPPGSLADRPSRVRDDEPVERTVTLHDGANREVARKTYTLAPAQSRREP